jgi:hypothetical protein
MPISGCDCPVPLILPEQTSNKIAAFIRELPAEQFTISHWTRVEVMVDESFAVLLPTPGQSVQDACIPSPSMLLTGSRLTGISTRISRRPEPGHVRRTDA